VVHGVGVVVRHIANQTAVTNFGNFYFECFRLCVNEDADRPSAKAAFQKRFPLVLSIDRQPTKGNSRRSIPQARHVTISDWFRLTRREVDISAVALPTKLYPSRGETSRFTSVNALFNSHKIFGDRSLGMSCQNAGGGAVSVMT